MKHTSIARLFAGAAFALAMTGVAWAKVDINHATEPQLQALHGVGPAKAHAIVVERQAHGRYASLGDISKRVPGIGAATVTGFAADVSFAPAGAAATPAAAVHPGSTPAIMPKAVNTVPTHTASTTPPDPAHAATKTGAAAAVHPVAATSGAVRTGATVSTHTVTTAAATPPPSATQRKETVAPTTTGTPK